eukprot:6490419-Prymnesium_polylepis.1
MLTVHRGGRNAARQRELHRPWGSVAAAESSERHCGFGTPGTEGAFFDASQEPGRSHGMDVPEG